MPNKDELRACWAFDEDWYMGWTTDRGLPRWIPMKIQEFIVLTWNRIVCRIKGHQIVGEISGPLKKAVTASATGGLSLVAEPIIDKLTGGGGGSKAPAPEPGSAEAIIKAQTDANQQTALYNAVLNRVNQVGPFGSVSWSHHREATQGAC
jgi:hypothetical protein